MHDDTAHPAAAYVVLEDALIEPWCSGVLVAPDIVLTTSACVGQWTEWPLNVGFGVPNVDAVEYAVARAQVLQADPRLAALVLRDPVEDIEPAQVVARAASACDVESVSYLIVRDGEPSERWSWSGCFTERRNELIPDDGSPNCHGDGGAPAFASSRELIGLVVHAAGSDCVESVTLALPGASDALAEALALAP